MRVLVMGAGGVGGFYGGALLARGHDVTLVARGAHLRALQARGLTIREGEHARVVHPVHAVGAPVDAGVAPDLVLFTVKGHDTAAAAATLRPVVTPATTVLTLQNGVESAERLGAVLGPDRILAGATVIEATVVEPGVIARMGPTPRIVLGEPDGRRSARADAVAASFRDAGIDARATDDIRRALWEKFVRLAPGATLTSACGASIGAVRDTPEGAALYRALVAEAVAVARSAGVGLPADAVDAALAFIRGLPAAMKTSMQRDFERGRPTELDELPGAVVRLGRQHGVPTPTFDVLHHVLSVRARAGAPSGGSPGPAAGGDRIA
jgi:2-dehydropantoate 2-reductase